MPHEKDQTHWHEPTGTRKAGYGEFKKQPTPYDAFMESEGIPVFRGIGIRRVQDLPLAPWKRTGGRGHYIQLHGTETKCGRRATREGTSSSGRRARCSRFR